jgi:hypothetical protein
MAERDPTDSLTEYPQLLTETVSTDPIVEPLMNLEGGVSAAEGQRITSQNLFSE